MTLIYHLHSARLRVDPTLILEVNDMITIDHVRHEAWDPFLNLESLNMFPTKNWIMKYAQQLRWHTYWPNGSFWNLSWYTSVKKPSQWLINKWLEQRETEGNRIVLTRRAVTYISSYGRSCRRIIMVSNRGHRVHAEWEWELEIWLNTYRQARGL